MEDAYQINLAHLRFSNEDSRKKQMSRLDDLYDLRPLIFYYLLQLYLPWSNIILEPKKFSEQKVLDLSSHYPQFTSSNVKLWFQKKSAHELYCRNQSKNTRKVQLPLLMHPSFVLKPISPPSKVWSKQMTLLPSCGFWVSDSHPNFTCLSKASSCFSEDGGSVIIHLR